ncbi:hypothetical protein [Actinoplanes sp. NPDC051851]|uniref:hypothetical protein n=1 Tax=Actinoplanes sp. NPDC051851 TaxID=3154753 RepID=UPI00341A368F
MRRNGPMFTLLAGIALAAVFFLLSMRATRTASFATTPTPPAGSTAEDSTAEDSGASDGAAPGGAAAGASGTATAGGSAPATAPSIDRVPLAAPVRTTATWAGTLKVGTLAVSAKNGTAIGYLCDGERIEAWLKGTAEDGRLRMTSTKGARLTGSFDEDSAAGTLRVGGDSFSFAISAVRKPSGLYRATAEIRGSKVVGGWIVLADGSQVGLGTVDGTVRETSPLNLTDGTATIDGSTVAASRTEGVA